MSGGILNLNHTLACPRKFKIWTNLKYIVHISSFIALFYCLYCYRVLTSCKCLLRLISRRNECSWKVRTYILLKKSAVQTLDLFSSSLNWISLCRNTACNCLIPLITAELVLKHLLTNRCHYRSIGLILCSLSSSVPRSASPKSWSLEQRKEGWDHNLPTPVCTMLPSHT